MKLKNKTNKLLKTIFLIITVISIFTVVFPIMNNIYATENVDVPVTTTTNVSSVDAIKMSASDEALNLTNLLIIVLISLNIVLIILGVTILLKINKKI